MWAPCGGDGCDLVPFGGDGSDVGAMLRYTVKVNTAVFIQDALMYVH